jgi:exonuclease III
VLTEYVEGPDHRLFLAALESIGLPNFSCTIQPGRENQVLIATRQKHTRCNLALPEIHRSVPSNVLKVTMSFGIIIVGFRMPSFVGKDRPLKRLVWDWLLQEADRLRDNSAIIVGDFNTAPTDSDRDCGDCFATLVAKGWQRPEPTTGYSWRHPRSGSERRIDHIFFSSALTPRTIEYLWSFEELVPDASVRTVGLPDHAMLICSFNTGDG